MAHLNVGIFALSSLQNRSRSDRLQGHFLFMPSLYYSTDVRSESGLDSGWAIQKS